MSQNYSNFNHKNTQSEQSSGAKRPSKIDTSECSVAKPPNLK